MKEPDLQSLIDRHELLVQNAAKHLRSLKKTLKHLKKAADPDPKPKVAPTL